MTNFQDLGLSADLLRAVARMKFDAPTPIQAQAIPHALAGRDVLGLAQTGTGKTAAFGLPLIERLLGEPGRARGRTAKALILAPTRELANQIAENLRAYAEGTPLGVTVVVGGASINMQAKRLERGVDILVATPGRLLDLIERRAVTLAETRALVLDEADQMLDIGFIHALRRIAKLLPSPRHTMLFSATMPAEISELADSYLVDPVKVAVTPPGKAADKVTQELHYVADQNDKPELLAHLMDKIGAMRALVFCRTKRGADKLKEKLEDDGFEVTAIHGNKSQNARERAIQDLKEGRVAALIATDVAARGIDIPGVTHVFNYDLPDVPDIYIHRIGRTARAGATGIAVSLCGPEEVSGWRAIERLMKLKVPVLSGVEPPARKRPTPGGQRRDGGFSQAPRRPSRGPKPAASFHAPDRSGKPSRPRRRKPNANAMA